MSTRYDKPSQEVISLLEEVREKYHGDRLDEVRIGILMAYAEVDENTGEPKGFAIKGHAGARAAASIKVVSLRGRVSKNYDVELVIDGDAWPQYDNATRIALLDHELTHLVPTGKLDDLDRPKIRMKNEDFIVWGFLEVVSRHGQAALEARSVKNLIDQHGQLLLGV